MSDDTQHPGKSVVASAVSTLAIVAVIVVAGLQFGGGDDDDGQRTAVPAATPTREVPDPTQLRLPTGPLQTGTPGATSADAEHGEPGESAGCPPPTVDVTTAEELTVALETAVPGDRIVLADGTYDGEFVATTSGTAKDPILLCGSSAAVLQSDGPEGGYVFHLDGADHWRLKGFTVRNGQKGVMADGTVGSVIKQLTVEDIGDEAIHLRAFSTDNVVAGNTIRRTGLRREKFGEGVYIGSATSNWCEYSDCEPDRSDRNVVRDNDISETTSEAIDVKEGTTGGLIAGNTFDGSGLTEADSWVDVKGNEWVIVNNRGTSSPEDGFQTHDLAEGWGERNLFRGNVADVAGGSGFGFHFAPVNDNRLTCDNTATGAAQGLANVECT